MLRCSTDYAIHARHPKFPKTKLRGERNEEGGADGSPCVNQECSIESCESRGSLFGRNHILAIEGVVAGSLLAMSLGFDSVGGGILATEETQTQMRAGSRRIAAVFEVQTLSGPPPVVP